MALQIIADKLDDLPEALREHAKEANGKFAVGALPQGWAVEDVGGLKRSLSAARATAKEATAKLRPYGWNVDENGKLVVAEGFEEPIDPAVAVDAVEKLKSGALKPGKDLEDFKRQLETKFTKDLESERTLRQKTESQLANEMIESRAKSAIAAAKGNMRLLLPIVKAATRFERNGDGKYHVTLVDDVGQALMTKKAGSTDGMSMEEFVSTLKDSPEYRGAFEGSGAGGAGTSSQSGGPGPRGQAVVDMTLSPEARLTQHYAGRTFGQ